MVWHVHPNLQMEGNLTLRLQSWSDYFTFSIESLFSVSSINFSQSLLGFPISGNTEDIAINTVSYQNYSFLRELEKFKIQIKCLCAHLSTRTAQLLCTMCCIVHVHKNYKVHLYTNCTVPLYMNCKIPLYMNCKVPMYINCKVPVSFHF